uniref:Uncharacterized protein n=1 Tax=Parascaris equorum TaxID=6256 RepID=A0A914RWQ8_PAREQ
MEFSFFQDLSFTVEPGLTVALAGRPAPYNTVCCEFPTLGMNLKGKSVLLIAHRLSTIEMTGKNSGDVEQQDAQAELVSQNGPYRSRFQRQMMRNEEVKSALPAITTSFEKSTIFKKRKVWLRFVHRDTPSEVFIAFRGKI